MMPPYFALIEMGSEVQIMTAGMGNGGTAVVHVTVIFVELRGH